MASKGLINGVTKVLREPLPLGSLRCGCPNDPSIPPGPIMCKAKGHRCAWCLHRGHGEETCELRRRGLRPTFVDYVVPVPVEMHAEMQRLRVPAKRDEKRSNMNGNGHGHGHGNGHMRAIPTEVTITPEVDFRKRLIHFMSEFCSRGFSVREATYKAIKATADSYNDGREISVSEEAFERLVAGFEADVEKWKATQQAAREEGGTAVAGGVVVEVVSDDEFRERARTNGARS